ncbi:MAG: glutamine--fructose-6-phosphate transaminase (isomerizing) [Acidimicrobiia bacterium]|nr:glutamine--fructose-6-phosphate transaminase (isomerizing) [Acidimicrobiia bacterium]
MCGIVGYAGPRPVQPLLISGLQRLEYRGYDSAGVAIVEESGIDVIRKAGRIAELEAELAGRSGHGTTGIGHTRWATHGAPNTINAHPHRDCSHNVAVAHNGIIENWSNLKAELIESGHIFQSDTDTEVVAHLIEDMADLPLEEAVRAVMRRAEGALALAVVRSDEPDLIVGARRGSPLVVGLGDGENFLASDIPAFLEYTKRMAVLDDDRVVAVRSGGVIVTDLDGAVVEPATREIEWDLESAEKSGFPDFMLKEIFEQPGAIRDTLRGRFDSDGLVRLRELDLDAETARSFNKVFVIACGTSYHAAMMAKYAIERWTRLPVEIDIASEFRYRDPVLDEKTLVIGISQSGETLDTLAAVRYAHAQGTTLIAVTNVVDSAMAREADAVLYTRAGPEIGVAATKTFTTQLVAMQLLALWLAHARGALDDAVIQNAVTAMSLLPDQVEEVLEQSDRIREMSEQWADRRDFFFLGRSAAFPVAMEGALKLKEIAYVRAEGYPAGEMKHGPIALIEEGVVVVGVATNSHVQGKMLSNIEEMRARAATIVLVLTEGDAEGEAAADEVIFVPSAPELLSPVTAVVPLQLLAYWLAKKRGLDVDKPRNLAKTVTVE